MNKLNVAVVTLFGNYNFGNKLQNYATVFILEKYFNSNAVTLVKMNSLFDVKEKIFDYLNDCSSALKRNSSIKKRGYLRKKKFVDFTKKYLNTKDTMILKSLNKHFDFFVVGSDQVWNTAWYKDKYLCYYLLSFANDEKRIAFAPSLGISHIIENQQKYFIKELSKYRQLSCRESEGCAVLHELINRQIDHLPDPTLVLRKNEWDKIRVESEYKPKKKYVLSYFLEDISEERKKRLTEFCNKNNLELVDLLDQKKDVYIAGPSEFIDLIADCEYFVTDSFHGVVFSIIYHKKFSVICGEKRVKMRSRIESLLNEFNLDKQWDNDLKLDKTDIDYEMIDEIVEKKRNLAINYLMNDLNF